MVSRGRGCLGDGRAYTKPVWLSGMEMVSSKMSFGATGSASGSEPLSLRGMGIGTWHHLRVEVIGSLWDPLPPSLVSANSC